MRNAQNKTAHISFNAQNGAELTFSGGIVLGSTEQQVVAAYREPTETIDVGSQKALRYKALVYSSIKFSVDETGTVISMEMENIK